LAVKAYVCPPYGVLRVFRLDDSFYLLRAEDRYTRFFEGLWEIPEGITYNSYVLLGRERRVVLDTVKAGFAGCFLEALRGIVEPRDVDIVVVHHSEPDHTGALPSLLREAGSVHVYAHPMAARFVEATYGVKLPAYTPVRDGVRVDLGGESLEFITTPWLHWPDTVMSLAVGRGVLFSGDVFGSYGIPDSFSDSVYGDISWYVPLLRKYLATVVGTYRQWIAKAMPKIAGLRGRVRMIAPLHGLILTRHTERVLSLYQSWGEGRLDEGKAVVVYASMYGSAEKAASTAAEELEALGFTVKLYGFTDHERSSIADVVGDVFDAKILVVAAATYEAGVMPIAEHLVAVLCKKAITPHHRILILSSYGWGGAAGRKLSEKLNTCKPEKLLVREAHGRLDTETVRRAVRELVA
jgi:flavorubredoxin